MEVKVQELPPLIKSSAAAKLIGVSRDTLANMIQDGRMCKPTQMSERVRLFETQKLLASLRAIRKRKPE